jgi:glutamate carboxypeptidase
VQRAFDALTPIDQRTIIECRGWFDRPPLERSEKTVRLYERARVVAAALGRELQEGSTGGGSDGNFTAALGVPTLDGLGAVGDGAHAAHEQVVISELAWRAALVAGLIAELALVK